MLTGVICRPGFAPQPDKAAGYFLEEKAAFPESSPFMDFQLKAFQKTDDADEAAQP